jgi:UDP-N-acetylglucosamine acyltransferase
MPILHPTAIVDDECELADDVEVGPYCVLSGPLRIGPGCRLVGNVHLYGPLTMGAGNTIYPFACLGFAPQSLSYDPSKPGQGLVIGDHNTFREGVTIHRAMTDHGPTTIGDRNYFMAASHAGHDCVIGNHCVFANGTLLAGHVTVEDRVITGGTATVHQFCRVGRGAMLSGSMGLSRDLPPWFMLTGNNTAGSINMIGLRRSGMATDAIEDARWVYKTLYRRGLSVAAAKDALRRRSDRPIVAEYLAFLEQSKRGLCPASGSSKRTSAAAAEEAETAVH